MKNTRSLVAVAALAALGMGCLSETAGKTTSSSGGPAPGPSVGGTDPSQNTANADAIQYRDIGSHPGCTVDGLSYPAAQINGYKCAAKEYAIPGTEDTSKPVVLLIHGNSSTPADYEAFTQPDNTKTPMLSERLAAQNVRIFAIDMRIDKTDDPTTNDPVTGNPAHNIDHGWGVPLVQHFIQSVMNEFPNRQISIVSFSLGPTVVRDALRRLHRANAKPFEHIDTLVYASGANHGVSSYQKLCKDPTAPANVTMRGRVVCEMGNRDQFTPTSFDGPLNGADGAFETPCLDGDTAYGQKGVCGGHKVNYVTVVMQDPPQGALQDEFVSQTASALKGAQNLTVSLADKDPTGYFYNGAFKNHFGSIRSEAGLKIILSALLHN
jgi:hypothetical protein